MMANMGDEHNPIMKHFSTTEEMRLHPLFGEVIKGWETKNEKLTRDFFDKAYFSMNNAIPEDEYKKFIEDVFKNRSFLEMLGF